MRYWSGKIPRDANDVELGKEPFMVNNARAVTLLLVMLAIPMAGQDQYPEAGTFNFEVKESAREQYAYASRISSSSSAPEKRIERVLSAVAALEQIPKRWPDDRPTSLAAYRLMVELFLGAGLAPNALESITAAERFFADDARRLVFGAYRAQSEYRLGRLDAADEAIDASLRASQFELLSPSDQNSVLREASFIKEQRNELKAAAKFARRAGRQATHALIRAHDIQRALELELSAADRVQAAKDLEELTTITSEARRLTLTADEVDALNGLSDAIERHRKKLKP